MTFGAFVKPSIVLPLGRLRPARETDTGTVLRLLTAPEVRKYLCDDKTLTEPEVAAMLDESTTLDAQGLGLWLIESDPGESIGLVGLAPVSEPLETLPETSGRIEPLIALDPRHWRTGLAKSALLGVMQYARDAMGLSELVAAVDAPNEASHRLLAACGFERYGTVPGVGHELLIYRATFNRP